jgi:hypothetical protein
MKITIIASALLLVAGQLNAEELRLFNPGIFGQSVEEPVSITLPADQKAIEPISILTDVKSGKFAGATVFYPKSISFDKARESINRTYKRYESRFSPDNPKMGQWRVSDRRFAIQLTETDEAIQVIYLPFMDFK